MDLTIIFFWILATFFIGSLAGIVGEKRGVVYPVAMVSALVIMANVFANKIVQVGPFVVPAGVLVFSMTFYITDLISEKWGKRYAKEAVWGGFLSSVTMVVSSYFVVHWQSAPFATEMADMFSQVFALTPRIAFASFVAYLVSQNHDVWAFHYWKKLTKGKHLWLRNNASTIVSQFLDSVIFITIAFYGIMPIWPLIVGQWAVKVIIALVDTPFMYVTIWIMDKVSTKGKRKLI